jgi:choline dehydrogenase
MSEQFDYIIVGAGSAGCVLANRLSANADTRVLLIESGPPDKSSLIDMPRAIGKLLAPGNPHVWSYEVSRGKGLGSETWLKGRTLGGSSAVNGMVYIRGHRADYDGWRAMGCKGWGWEDMGPCFEALEDHELGHGYHRGVGGPVHVTVHPSGDELSEAILSAAEQAGTPRVADVNDCPDGGFGYQTRNIWHGKRQSAAKAFLRPIMHRANLKVLTDTDVLKVLFERRRAVAVQICGASGVSRADARREVILAAGALESPKLLQISGIGDPSLLLALGIPVVAESSEVGRNLQEHCYFQVKFAVNRGSLNSRFTGLPLLGSVLQYLLFSKGPMTHAAHELMGFVKTRPGLMRPDAQLGVGLYSIGRTDKGLGIDAEPGMTIGGYFMNPESRGNLKIASADQKAAPIIDANFLADAGDRSAAVSMVRYIRKIAAQNALKAYISAELNPGPRVTSDEDILRVFLEQGSTAFHVSGTCRMGADERSVVDPQLCVRGVEGLRVVDTSVFPKLVSGNTHAPAMALALRASQLILA